MEKHTTFADAVLDDEKNGNVTIATIDGFLTYKLDPFIDQPTDGLLYDLNINKATLLTMLGQKDQKEALLWVNRYAAMRVIERLKQQRDEALQALRNADARRAQ